MLHDNETNCDFLNFKAIANTVSELIVQAKGKPLSIGISGGWGVGKSSMVHLIADALHENQSHRFLFVEFNAWLYQGYDDARAALMDVIAQTIVKHCEESKTGLDKAKELLGRVNWLRVAGIAAQTSLVMAGLPPLGLIGDTIKAFRNITDGNITEQDMKDGSDVTEKIIDGTKGFINQKQMHSPPKEIQNLRDQFSKILSEMGVTLVVLIDDLDRCLPNTAISTLEAIRLFLFLDHTAFIIAADEQMIRHAVKAHFKDAALDDKLVTNYFDKLIQIPIRVPPLGTQDVRAYLMLLYLYESGLPEDQCNIIREKVCSQLALSWEGKRVDRAFMNSVYPDCNDALKAKFDLADRLAPIMTTAKEIAGNPRLIKRFLNTLAIRMTVARIQKVTVDETILAKMLLFERCGDKDTYSSMIESINNHPDGKPEFLKEIEHKVALGESLVEHNAWETEFAKGWLALPPLLSDLDLRPVVYISRENMQIITDTDKLSEKAINILEALFCLKDTNKSLQSEIGKLPRPEIAIITNKVLLRARQEQMWGTPPILYACLVVADSDQEQCLRFISFFKEIPVSKLQAPLIPIIGTKTWAKDILKQWKDDANTSNTVKRAIEALSRRMK